MKLPGEIHECLTPGCWLARWICTNGISVRYRCRSFVKRLTWYWFLSLQTAKHIDCWSSWSGLFGFEGWDVFLLLKQVILRRPLPLDIWWWHMQIVLCWKPNNTSKWHVFGFAVARQLAGSTYIPWLPFDIDTVEDLLIPTLTLHRLFSIVRMSSGS